MFSSLPSLHFEVVHAMPSMVHVATDEHDPLSQECSCDLGWIHSSRKVAQASQSVQPGLYKVAVSPRRWLLCYNATDIIYSKCIKGGRMKQYGSLRMNLDDLLFVCFRSKASRGSRRPSRLKTLIWRTSNAGTVLATDPNRIWDPRT